MSGVRVPSAVEVRSGDLSRTVGPSSDEVKIEPVLHSAVDVSWVQSSNLLYDGSSVSLGHSGQEQGLT